MIECSYGLGGLPMLIIPQELAEALRQHPQAREVFLALPDYQQASQADWIACIPTIDGRVRSAQDLVERLVRRSTALRNSGLLDGEP